MQSPDAVAANVRAHTAEQQRADAAFRLGNFFRRHGYVEESERYWQLAQELNPDSINFFRQNLTLTEEGSAGERFMQRRMEYEAQGKDYYRPLDIEAPAEDR